MSIKIFPLLRRESIILTFIGISAKVSVCVHKNHNGELFYIMHFYTNLFWQVPVIWQKPNYLVLEKQRINLA